MSNRSARLRFMQKKIKIACLLQMFGIGGMPKWLYTLAGALANEFDFTFIATHSKVVMPEYREVAHVVTLPFNKWILAAYLWYGRYDIVQVANLRLYTEAALLAKVPVVIERVDGLRRGTALQDKSGLHAVIASTKGIVPQLEKMIQPEKIHLIYNGADLNKIDLVAPQRFGFDEEDIIVGRTSRLAGGKNISLLIRAVIEIRKHINYKHVRLVICGGDTRQPGAVPMIELLKEEARLLGKSVVFTGEVFETASITKGYDIATCTSRPHNEGIPNSLIEAMAAGKPVVASAVDDVPELIEDGHTGLLFSDDNCEELVDRLKRLIDEKAMRVQMGMAGRKKVEEYFDLKDQSRKYADLYHMLLARWK